jgi:TRAP-type uncharacterized transport system fused permease subunit
VKLLDLLARICAILAGVLLTLITLMTCASLIGRNTTGTTLVGDFELTGVATGAAIALFMPWCQVRHGNIIVDFFTAKASARTNALLDRLGALLLAGRVRPARLAHHAWRVERLDRALRDADHRLPRVGGARHHGAALHPHRHHRPVAGGVRPGRCTGGTRMSAVELTLGIFAVMLVLMAIRVPISVSMFVAGTTGYLVQTGWGPFSNFLNTQAFARFASYDLSVIPLFILMGHFATQGGISKALFSFAAAIMGRFKGGLAMASVLACAAFGAICGSSVATAATITSVALPEMKRHGYSGRLATGTLAAAGTLGILIPPSVPLVIYAILTEQNIAKLFAAAMVPGIIAMFGYMVAIAIYVRLVPGPGAGDRRRTPR